MTTPPPIDWQQCLALSNQNPQMAQELLGMFMKDLPSYRQKIQQACEQGDATTLYQHVHKLHGATCYCGMPHLQRTLNDFETDLKTQQSARFKQHLAAVLQAIDDVSSCYEKQSFNASSNA